METKRLLNSNLIRIIFIGFTIFHLMGCQEEEPFRSYLRMTLNGEKVECNYYIRASDYVSPTLMPNQTLSVTGTWNEGNIEFNVTGFDNTIGKKTFTVFDYVWVGLLQPIGNRVFYRYVAGGDDVNFTILEVNERYIKGVFDLKAEITQELPYDSLIITNGEFHIDRRE